MLALIIFGVIAILFMDDVSEFVKRLLLRFNHVWLIEWTNDCPDDVFELKLGISF